MAVVALAGVAVGAGCGGSSPRQQVRATMEAFAKASANKDYATLCNKVLAPDLLAQVQAIGLPCEVALQQGLGGVQQPSLAIRQIKITGKRHAQVLVNSTAAGEVPSQDIVRVIKTAKGWRIESLASPANGASAGD